MRDSRMNRNGIHGSQSISVASTAHLKKILHLSQHSYS